MDLNKHPKKVPMVIYNNLYKTMGTKFGNTVLNFLFQKAVIGNCIIFCFYCKYNITNVTNPKKINKRIILYFPELSQLLFSSSKRKPVSFDGVKTPTKYFSYLTLSHLRIVEFKFVSSCFPLINLHTTHLSLLGFL